MADGGEVDHVVELSPRTISPPSSPDVIPPKRLKVTFNASQTTRAIAVANRDLSLLHLQSALKQYTKILETSPGHPVAFLNRCLCYLILGFPNLAVFDAHRALLAVEAINRKNPDDINGRSNLYNLHLYTQEADEDEDSWKTEPSCYV